ncbi:MAG: AGE family epimerase/isomerase [Acetanaerobacterium sp.]
MDVKGLQNKYKTVIEQDLMRFWERAFDTENGGVFTCFSNDGASLITKDKYTWSQGRMLWVLARLCEMRDRGLISIDRRGYEEQAHKTYRFILEHALLQEEGVCAYLLDERGTKIESIPGKGYYTSYFVDCFVIMGFLEYGRVFGVPQAIEQALCLYDKMMGYLNAGEIRSEPYPVRKGFRPHSKNMILCNVCCVARDALRCAGHSREKEFEQAARRFAHEIIYGFYNEENGLIREMIGSNKVYDDTVLARHIAPGHCNECMWFCMDAVEGDRAAMARIYSIAEKNLEAGWDHRHGGVFRFLDKDGTPPHGRRIHDAYEDLIADTWDTKLWWVHAESLYTSLRCYCQTGKAVFADSYSRIEQYVFSHFPNPNREIGEWIQILDREGEPLNKVVALPVKDPYHILRNVMLIVEMLSKYQ